MSIVNSYRFVKCFWLLKPGWTESTFSWENGFPHDQSLVLEGSQESLQCIWSMLMQYGQSQITLQLWCLVPEMWSAYSDAFVSASVPPRHLLHSRFLVILLHLHSPNVFLGWQDHCGDPLTLTFGTECFHTLFSFFRRHKFFSASINSSIIIIIFQQWPSFISSAVQKCIRHYFRDGRFAYYDVSSAHHRFCSLNIRYLSFFSSVFRKGKDKKTKNLVQPL